MNFNKKYKSISESVGSNFSDFNLMTPLLVKPADYSRVLVTDRATILPIIKPNKSYNVSNHNFFLNTANKDNISGVYPGTPMYKKITNSWERLPAVKVFFLKNRDESDGPFRSSLTEDDKDCLFIVNEDIIEYYAKIFKKNTKHGITQYYLNGFIEDGIFNRPGNYLPVNYDYFEPSLSDLDAETRDTFKDIFGEL